MHEVDRYLEKSKQPDAVCDCSYFKGLIKKLLQRQDKWRKSLITVLFSYWQNIRRATPPNGQPLHELLKLIPDEPSLLLSSRKLSDPEQSVCRDDFIRILSGHLNEQSAGVLQNDLSGHALTVKEKKQLESVKVLLREIRRYSEGDYSLEAMLHCCISQLDTICRNGELLRAVDEYFIRIPIHSNEIAVPPITVRQRNMIPGFFKKIDAQLKQQHRVVRESAHIGILELIASPWPWNTRKSLLSSLPWDNSFRQVRNALEKLDEYIANSNSRNFDWLRSLGSAFDLLNQAMSSMGLNGETKHEDIVFVEGLHKRHDFTVVDLHDLAQNLANDNSMSEQFCTLSLKITRDGKGAILRQELLKSRPDLSSVSEPMIALFPDLEAVWQIWKECHSGIEAEPTSLQNLFREAGDERVLLDQGLKSRVQEILANAFHLSRKRNNPEELARRFGWIGQARYSDIVQTEMLLWLNLALIVGRISTAPDERLDIAAMHELVGVLLVNRKTSLPDAWLNQKFIKTLFEWLERTGTDKLFERIPTDLLSRSIAKEMSITLRHKIHCKYIQENTSQGELLEKVEALENWKNHIQTYSDEKLLSSVLVEQLKNRAGASLLDQLSDSFLLLIKETEMSGHPFTWHLHQTLPSCANVDEFMVLVKVAEKLGSPVVVGEIPEHIRNGRDGVNLVWQALALCNEPGSVLETKLQAVRMMYSLKLSEGEGKFIQWYAKENAAAGGDEWLPLLLTATTRLEDAGLSGEQWYVLLPERPQPANCVDRIHNISVYQGAIRELAETHTLHKDKLFEPVLKVICRESLKMLNSFIKAKGDWNKAIEEIASHIEWITTDRIEKASQLLEDQKNCIGHKLLYPVLSTQVKMSEREQLERGEEIINLLTHICVIVDECKELVFTQRTILSEDVDRIPAHHRKIEKLIRVLRDSQLGEEIKNRVCSDIEKIGAKSIRLHTTRLT